MPSRDRPGDRRGARRRQHPARGRLAPRRDARALRPPDRRRQRRERGRARRVAARRRAGARETSCMLTLGTGVGGGVIIDGALYRGWAELGHVVVVADGAAVPGHLHRAAATSRRSRRGTRPTGARERLWGDEARRAEQLVERARGGRPGGARGAGRDRASARRGDRLVRRTSSARSSCRRRRLRHRRGRFLSSAGARGRAARGARARAASGSGSSTAELGADAGLIGAGLLAFEASVAEAVVPLAVCATPIGNLDDVTLRVLDELRGGRRRALRGHAAHEGPARPARDRGQARSATTGTTRRSARRSCCRGSRRASGSRSSRMRACPGVNDPGRAADRGRARGAACR